MNVSVIDDAVALLHQGLADARVKLAAVTEEVQRIESALTSLGYATSTNAQHPDHVAVVGVGATGSSGHESPDDDPTTTPIMTKVRELLEARSVPLSPAEIFEELRPTDHRTDQRLKSSIRTALYHMRKRGKATSMGDGRTILNNQLPPQYAETPAVTGVSDLIPAEREGVVANGAVPDRHHDEDSSRQADHRVVDHRAPVGG